MTSSPKSAGAGQSHRKAMPAGRADRPRRHSASSSEEDPRVIADRYHDYVRNVDFVVTFERSRNVSKIINQLIPALLDLSEKIEYLNNEYQDDLDQVEKDVAKLKKMADAIKVPERRVLAFKDAAYILSSVVLGVLSPLFLFSMGRVTAGSDWLIGFIFDFLYAMAPIAVPIAFLYTLGFYQQ
ncbi:uncharacterized protein F4807DRAFT_457669 [Annulohypoxylon truncatum]|uniref:uncharacterized protein n=1 Tax=Annulohypoxylon truncatum TaxID=327061 RepID=UPI002007A0B7|nr:uncharacterized protein F4807DRAFT_457669 [Annulohypoxylon truncatum]KAI1212168.1 hypothetical protein F4807DRAFT_457669 [Annulohypoxylon truncatum]